MCLDLCLIKHNFKHKIIPNCCFVLRIFLCLGSKILRPQLFVLCLGSKILCPWLFVLCLGSKILCPPTLNPPPPTNCLRGYSSGTTSAPILMIIQFDAISSIINSTYIMNPFYWQACIPHIIVTILQDALLYPLMTFIISSFLLAPTTSDAFTIANSCSFSSGDNTFNEHLKW